MIVGPPEDGVPNRLADWIELQAFGSPTKHAQLGDINGSLEIAEDSEPEEMDQENLLEEQRLQWLLAALEERQKTMKGSYPFDIDTSGQLISLKAQLTEGAFAYLFCLIVSNAAKGGLLAGEGAWTPNLVTARNLFQICATVASAGHVGGPAWSVGAPRPDVANFIEKLRSVYEQFGDGAVHKDMPRGAPDQVKDDEIDVVARQRGDDKPPMGYFLGQAATGANWKKKSLKGSVDKFHTTWFAKVPAVTPKVGIIIPFVLPSESDAHGDENLEDAITEELRRFAAWHGELLYRQRVARFVDQGRELHKAGTRPIERIDELREIEKFVSQYQAQLVMAMSAA